MDELNENEMKHVKVQEDLIKLIRVLDECIETVDNFYCASRKREMLGLSTAN